MSSSEIGFHTDNLRPADPIDDGLPLGAIFHLWWRRRVVIALLILTGGVAAALLAASLFLLRPVTRESVLNFRLLFKGVEDGSYPNGERFTPSDIVATAVLQKVYDRDGLAQFVPFDVFKNSLAVAPYNPALNRLRRDYEDRLAARLLNTIERQKIEAEFQDKAAALKNAEFVLIMGTGSRFKSWPDTLSAKVLTDIIDVWLADARDRGVFRFNFNIYSANVLPVDSTDVDYLIFVDQIRLAIKRIEGNIDDLLKVPGAGLMRLGAKQVSLGELRAKLDDAVHYKLGTIESAITQFGFFRNKDLAAAYLKDQMFRLQLQTNELNAQTKTIEGVQTSYANSSSSAGTSQANGGGAEGQGGLGVGSGTMIAQLSDTFLDRVMKLSERSSDVAFRQSLANRVIAIQNQAADIDTTRKLYERQLDGLEGKAQITAGAEVTKAWMEKQLVSLLGDLRSALDDLQLFHTQLSQRNLEPGTAYELVGPVRPVTISTLSLGKIAGFALLLGLMIGGLGLVIVTWRGLNPAENPVQPNVPETRHVERPVDLPGLAQPQRRNGTG